MTHAMRLLIAGSAVLLSVLTGSAEAQIDTGDNLPVHEVALSNGMRLLVLPREGAPTVSFVVSYDVGSIQEQPGKTGIAHLLEHLLFKGTTTIGTRDVSAERVLFAEMDQVFDTVLTLRSSQPGSPRIPHLEGRIEELEDSARTFLVPNEFDGILSRNGARGLNATTTAEITHYFVELPANRTELWFVLEADRMRNPVFREFYAERGVVMEERRMRVETSPGGLLYESHLATAFRVHPYGAPVVGWMYDLESLTRRDVVEYYRRYYGPDRAVVAIVGDVDIDRIEQWARTYFEPIPAGGREAEIQAREPMQRGERRVEVEFDAEPTVRIGWHIPPALHDDMAALAMLTTILTGGRTSRLYTKLVVEDRLAAVVTASMGPGNRYPRLFQISAVPRTPHTIHEIEDSIYLAINDLQIYPPTEAELERVRNRLRAAEVRNLRSKLGLALTLARSQSVYGDWRTSFRLSRRLLDVEPEDVQAVARRYFTQANRTVAFLTNPAR